MPKFKVDDVVEYKVDDSIAIIRQILVVDGTSFYVFSDEDGTVAIQDTSYFDLYSKPYTKYVKGAIWLSADKSKAFIVESEKCMSRLFEREQHQRGGGRTGHDLISEYEELYGPLIRWERTYRG